jgi:hypothetical protein
LTPEFKALPWISGAAAFWHAAARTFVAKTMAGEYDCAAIDGGVAPAHLSKPRLDLHRTHIPNKKNTVFRGHGLTMMDDYFS